MARTWTTTDGSRPTTSPSPAGSTTWPLNWRSGPWGANIAQNFVLGYRDASETRRVGSYETWDVQGSWEGWRGLGITLGVKNVMDRDPPASDQGQSFQVGYDPRYTDPRGRMYYMGLKYAFK